MLRHFPLIDSKRHFPISYLRDLPFGVTLALESLNDLARHESVLGRSTKQMNVQGLVC